MQLDLVGEEAKGPPCLEVIRIVGEVRHRGDFLEKSDVDRFMVAERGLEDIEEAKVAAERLSLITGEECWVVNRSRDCHDRRVVYRFSVKSHTHAAMACPA